MPRVESGYYVAAATGAKITLFLPAAVTQMAFPRIARVIADPAKIRRILAQNFTFVTILGIVSTLVIFVFSHLIVSVLFGHRFDAAADTIGLLSVASAELGVMTLMTYYFLARKMMFANFSWLGVAAAALAIWGFHANPTEIAKVMVVTTSATLLVQVVVAWFSLPRDSLATDHVGGGVSFFRVRSQSKVLPERLEAPFAVATSLQRHRAGSVRSIQRAETA